MNIFATYKEAEQGGFSRSRPVRHRGFVLYRKDVSGGRCFGCDFAIGVRCENIGDDGACGYELESRCFGSAESVWFTQELNSLRQRGCFAQFFTREVWDRGVADAIAAIDAWYAAHPDAAAARARVEARLARIAERQAARKAARGVLRMAMRERRNAAVL